MVKVEAIARALQTILLACEYYHSLQWIVILKRQSLQLKGVAFLLVLLCLHLLIHVEYLEVYEYLCQVALNLVYVVILIIFQHVHSCGDLAIINKLRP